MRRERKRLAVRRPRRKAWGALAFVASTILLLFLLADRTKEGIREGTLSLSWRPAAWEELLAGPERTR
jgi:hypothetical protein